MCLKITNDIKVTFNSFYKLGILIILHFELSVEILDANNVSISDHLL